MAQGYKSTQEETQKKIHLGMACNIVLNNNKEPMQSANKTLLVDEIEATFKVIQEAYKKVLGPKSLPTLN
jgi:hypothetical protein